MALEHLFQQLSIRAKNVCRRNDINNIDNLIDYYKRGGKFSSFKNCGRRTIEELNDILKKALDFKSDESFKLFVKNSTESSNNSPSFSDLTARAQNVCLYNNLSQVEDILLFYEKGGSFSSLRNCGKKTILELENFVNQKVNSKIKYREIFAQILADTNKWKLLELELQNEFKNLSVRAKNGYFNLLESRLINHKEFIKKAIIEDYNFIDIGNIGEKSSRELDIFKAFVKTKILSALNNSDSEVFLEIRKIEIYFNIVLDDITRESIIKKKLNIFNFFEVYILKNKSLLNKIENELLIEHLYSKEIDITKISQKVGVSRERVRQLKVLFLKNLHFHILSDLIPYCDEPISSINFDLYDKIDNTRLNKILGLILQNHSIIYSGENLDSINISSIYDREFYLNSRDIKVNYIINKDFINKEICKTLLNDIFRRKTKKVKKDYFFNPFLNFNFNNNQKEFLIKLITENFNCDYSEEGFLIKRNTFISLDEIIVNVLVEEDKPLLISEIYQIIDKLHPGKCKSEEALRGTITREKDKFIHLRGARGPKTLYGLKEWEQTKNIKSGSIKQLCIDYLNAEQFPVHMLELARFIMKHRETNRRNIIGNLKLDPHNNFIFFKSNFIGLAKKKYSKKFIDSIKILSSTLSQRINQFLKNNIYYNYEAVVSKFAKELKVFPIQIEQSILHGIDNGILKQKEEKIYYNSIQEDSIINDLFISEDEIKISGYNPYRVSIDDKKVVIRIKQSLNNNVSLNDIDFQNDGFYGGGYFSPGRCLIVYSPSLNQYRAYLWFNEIKIDEINTYFKFNNESDFAVIKVSSQTNIVDFSRNKSKKFISFLKILLESNMRFEDYIIDGKSIKMDHLDVEGLSELNAISKITSEVFEKYNIELEISESREIYQRIKLAKN